MAKKKDYMRLFADYCLRHHIWFAVCTGGEIDQVTFFTKNNGDVTVGAPQNKRFGEKSGFEWLAKEHLIALQGD